MTNARPLDAGSLTVAAITLLLFIAALFVKGFTHDLFLEAGLFLVSVKIIMMAYRNAVATKEVSQKLDQVLAALTTRDHARRDPRDADAAR